MIHRQLDSNEDWVFGKGKQSFLNGNAAIALNIKTWLKSWQNDCFFAPNDGAPWSQILGQKSKDIVTLSIKNQLLNCYGVVAVTDFSLKVDEKRNAKLTFVIDTFYSQNYRGVLTL